MKVPFVDLKAQFALLQKEIRNALNRVLESQKFILGEEGRELEREISVITGTKIAIGCASGTDALMLSLKALGVGEGDEVITTCYSFFATAGMISWVGARPVFVDIDPETFNMRPESVAAKVTPRTKAIIAAHLFGQCCAVPEAASAEIPVIEDAAQAIGSTRAGKPAGSMGICGCFSFFPTKNLGGYGDGGMVVTNDEKFANRIRLLRGHGQQEQRYHHEIVGTNSRLDEIQAAILRVKLKYLNDWNQKRASHVSFYQTHLKNMPVELPHIEEANVSNFHQYVIKTDKRDQLKNFLTDQGIGTAVYYPVILPLQPCFSELGHQTGEFPHAEKCAKTNLALPVYAELRQDQLEFVVEKIHTFFR